MLILVHFVSLDADTTSCLIFIGELKVMDQNIRFEYDDAYVQHALSVIFKSR